MNKRIGNIIMPLIIIFMLVSISPSYGDDTEVFFSTNTAKPNLLFLLDNSGSMNDDMEGDNINLYNPTTGAVIGSNPAFSPPSRLTVLQQAVQSVLANAPDNVNVGLMRFGPGMVLNGTVETNQGLRTHGVNGAAFPIIDINNKARTVIPDALSVYNLPSFPDENATVRDYLSSVVNSWAAAGGTPIVDALYEAALYLRGEKMHYGLDSPTGVTQVGAHPSTYTGTIITSDITTGARDYSTAPSYISPINSSCQSNYIVLMSDGKPTYYYDVDLAAKSPTRGLNKGPFADLMQGKQAFGTLAASVPKCAESPSGFISGSCGPELTKYISENGVGGNQGIKTYSVGFGANLTPKEQSYLRSLETIEDDPATLVVEDGYFSATDPDSLARAFRNILSAVSEPRGTMASPGYSVNVKNGLEHENDIYIPVFDHKNSSRWSGNLKKFKLVDVGGERHIQGKNNLDATTELGGFTGDALDYWSSSSNAILDGIAVQRGGVASKLDDPIDRKVYSNLTGDNNVNLSDSSHANEVSIANINNINDAELGLSGSSLEYRKQIIRFMRGQENGEENGAPRFHMGDMLHSEPLVITYKKADSTGVGKKKYIFAGTNEGYLHAFDTDTGEEAFAFIPKKLLSKLSETQFLNAGTQVDHAYGIDGGMTVWHNDINKDGNVDSGEQVILYFGLRRGGSSYYALDVSEVDKPKLLWTKSHDDYASMGQSWSAPYLARVGVGSAKVAKEVVIISGGYDATEDRNMTGTRNVDNAQSSVTATIGNDILILDAKNGSLLWSLSNAQRGLIKSSIPGGVRVLDTNYNGLVDRMYFADTGGHVWRLDLTERIGATNASSDLTKFATLGGAGSAARKFYNEPDVAKMKLKGRTVFSVSVGSGFRAHPLDKTIEDKFFILVEKSPYHGLVKTGPESGRFSSITIDELADITISSTGISPTNSIKDSDKRGWKIHFNETGEKVLGGAVAVDGNILFTSLVPEALQATNANGVDNCAAPITQSRFYAINLLTGEAGMDLDHSGGEPSGITDAYITVGSEILGKPQIVYNPLVVTTVTPIGAPNAPPTRVKKTCTHPVDIRTGKKLSQASGYDACRLESVYWSDPITGQ